MKLLVGILLASLVASSPASPPLEPRPLGEDCASCTADSVYLQADAKGRVFLLRSQDLLVYPVNHSGLGTPVKLKALPGESTLTVDGAALSPDGRDWLLLTLAAPSEVRYFRNGEEKPLPSPDWALVAVALPGGTPVLAAQAGLRESVADSSPTEEPPLLLRWTGNKWETLFSEPYDFSALGVDPADPASFHKPAFGNLLLASREALLAHGPKGSLWLAARNTYRIRHFSAAGRVRSDLRLGEGKLELRPRRTIEAFAVAPEGTAYALVQASENGKEGLALDRFGSACGCLERTQVRFPPLDGSIQMAAGKDGLYFASTKGSGSRWWLSWEQIGGATWREVPEAEISFHSPRSE